MQKADYSFISKLGDISGDGIAVYDLNSRKFVYTNKYFREIFELKEGSQVDDGAILLKFMSEEDRDHIRDRYEELLSIGCISPTEFALKVKNSLKQLSGDVLWLEESYAMAVFVKDITKLKENEEYIIKYTAQKDAILEMLIHNLSGPLALSKDVISSIEKTGKESDPAHTAKLLGIIRQNTQECINIVNDFLTREFTDSSFTNIQKSRFDCLQRINEILAMIGEMNNNKEITLRCSLKALIINSDPIKLMQVIQNLISNAIKFTPSQGAVTVSVADEEKSFTIEIKDNGIGIPDDHKPLIFTEKITGRIGLNGEISNGKGLFLTHKLVEILGGKIWFESEEGSGSSFFINFPKEKL